jgi:hypothetical protein
MFCDPFLYVFSFSRHRARGLRAASQGPTCASVQLKFNLGKGLGNVLRHQSSLPKSRIARRDV